MDTGIPSFNTIISNCKYAFDISWSTSYNKLVSSFRSSLVWFVPVCVFVFVSFVFFLLMGQGPEIKWNDENEMKTAETGWNERWSNMYVAYLSWYCLYSNFHVEYDVLVCKLLSVKSLVVHTKS